MGLELTFRLQKPPIRHGDEGVVRGVHGEDIFYVFVPRCGVEGALTLDGRRVPVQPGQVLDQQEAATGAGDDGVDSATVVRAGLDVLI